MHSRTKDKVWSCVIPCALGALSLLACWLLIGGRHFDLRVPLTYSSDGPLILLLIKRAMENPWIFHSSALGAPFGSYLYDYPVPDSGSLLVLKALGIASGSAGIALNLYYLLGYPINAVAAYFVLRSFGISRAFSFVGGFTFTLLPFHFLRVIHLFYTWYFAAPIFIWYACRVYSGNLNFLDKNRGLLERSVHAIGLLALSCFGVYYAFFGILTLLTAGAARYMHTRSIKSVSAAILAVTIVTVGIAANVTPNLIDRVEHGVNAETAQRSPAEAELYGLKIDQLLLPRPDHRFMPFSRLNEEYSTTFPLVNENKTASLGLIGSVGFLALLIILISPRKEQPTHERLYILALLTLFLVLFCTVGGFSALFSILISPMIRAWNRVSVFIAFTSICAAMLLADQRIAKYKTRTHFTVLTTGVAVFLCATAIWDQTTAPCLPCLKESQAAFHSDAQFVAAIERREPGNSAIYQLPYVRFPETPPIDRLQTYDQARGYLHSSSLAWSYGTMKGRPGDLFFRALSLEPLKRQIDVARRMGFGGLYVDRRGYADNGAEVEAELTRLLGAPPTSVSENANQVFFDLRAKDHAVAQLPRDLSPEQIMERAGFIVNALGERYQGTLSDGIDFSRRGAPTFLSDLSGLSAQENWGRWSDANVFPYVSLRFVQPLPKRFILHVRVQAFGPNADKPASIVIGQQTETFLPTADMREFSLPFNNLNGASLIEIHPSLPTSPRELGLSTDGRKLGIGVQKLWIETTP